MNRTIEVRCTIAFDHEEFIEKLCTWIKGHGGNNLTYIVLDGRKVIDEGED